MKGENNPLENTMSTPEQTPASPAHGTISWHEILGADSGGLQRFYGKLFGWRFPAEDAPYGLFAVNGDRPTGGIGAIPEGKSWTTFYVTVDDLDAAMKQAADMGATLIRDIVVMEHEQGSDRFCVMADPAGNPIGLVQHTAPAA